MAHNVWHDWGEILKRENKGREFRQNIQEGAAFTANRLQEMSQENNARGVMMRYVAGGAKNVGEGYQWLTEPLKYAAEEGDRIAPGIPTGKAFLGQLLLSTESLAQTLHKRSGRGAEMLATGEELYNPITKKRIGKLPNLGIDAPLAKGIAQGITGITSEILLEKGLGKGLKALDKASNLIPPKSPSLVPVLADGSTTVTRNVDDFVPSSTFQYSDSGRKAGNTAMRGQAIDLVSPPGSIKNYKALSEYPDWFIDPVTGRKVKSFYITNVHHVDELSFSRKAAAAHKSFADVRPGHRSALIEAVEKKGSLYSGNAKQNLADVLSIDGAKFRGAEIEAIRGVWGKDNIASSTVNDLLRGSDPEKLVDVKTGVKFNNPDQRGLTFAEVKPEYLPELQAWKAKHPNKPWPGFDEDIRELVPGSVYPSRLIGKDHFPMIRIKDGNGNLIENYRPKTLKEYQNRFNYVQQRLGIKTKLDRGALKLDPKLKLMGGDHDLIHSLQNTFKKQPGNPLHALETAINNGTYRNMNLARARDMYIDAHLFQERVAAHVLSKRYAKIQELWLERFPNGNGRGALSFDDLGKKAQQKFFKENVAEIGTRGGLRDPVSLVEAGTEFSFENWTPGMSNVFGWTPNKKFIKTKKYKNIEILTDKDRWLQSTGIYGRSNKVWST